MKRDNVTLTRATGFSVVEVVLATSLLGLMTVGTTQLMTNIQGSQTSMQYHADADALNEAIRTNLASPDACLNTFGGLITDSNPKLAVTRIMDNKPAPGQVLYAVGAKYGTGNSTTVTSFALSDLTPGAQAYQAQMTLYTQSQSTKTSMGPQTLTRTINISLQMDTFKKITSCVALARITDVIWKPTTLNLANVYFNNEGQGGSVGINTNAPGRTLDVAGELRSRTVWHYNMPVNLIPNTAGVGGNAQQGMGINFDIDYVGGRWVTGGDGVNSGAAALLMDHAEGDLKFHTFPSIIWTFGRYFSPTELKNQEFMRLTSNGRLGLGIKTPNYQLHLSTDSAAKPGSGAWTIASDRRLKDIRGTFTRGLAAVKAIAPRYFRYRAGNALDLPSDREYVGVVAQSVARAVPEAVSRDERKYLHVTNDAIQWTMLNAVRELAAKNQDLRRRIAHLRQRARGE